MVVDLRHCSKVSVRQVNVPVVALNLASASTRNACGDMSAQSGQWMGGQQRKSYQTLQCYAFSSSQKLIR